MLKIPSRCLALLLVSSLVKDSAAVTAWKSFYFSSVRSIGMLTPDASSQLCEEEALVQDLKETDFHILRLPSTYRLQEEEGRFLSQAGSVNRVGKVSPWAISAIVTLTVVAGVILTGYFLSLGKSAELTMACSPLVAGVISRAGEGRKRSRLGRAFMAKVDSKTYEEKFEAAQSLLRQGENLFRRKRWIEAIAYYHQATPLFRKLTGSRDVNVAEMATRLFVHATEQEHRAGAETAEQERLQGILEKLRLASQALPGHDKFKFVVSNSYLPPESMISVQSKGMTDRTIVEFRKAQLEEGIPIRCVVVRSDNRQDSTRGRIFVLDGHHRARAAFELGSGIDAYLITVPSALAERIAETARATHGGKWMTIPEMPFQDYSLQNDVSLTKAADELESSLARYERGERTNVPIMVNFERRGAFMTWEDIRDYLPMLRRKSHSTRNQVRAYRLPDNRLRIVNQGADSGIYLEKSILSKLTAPMIKAILDDVLREEGEKRNVRDLIIIDGERERISADAFTVGVRNTKRRYRIRRTRGDHPDIEIERSIIASIMHLGPRIIFAETQRPDAGPGFHAGVIVQEFYSINDNVATHGPKLSDRDQGIVGQRLAEKLYLMFDTRRAYGIIHRFDGLAQNLFLLRSKGTIKVRFVDWRMAVAESTQNRSETVTNHLQKLIPIIQAYLSPMALAHFILRLKELTQHSDTEADLYEKAYQAVRVSMGKGSRAFNQFFIQTSAIVRQLEVTKPPTKGSPKRSWIFGREIPFLLFAFMALLWRAETAAADTQRLEYLFSSPQKELSLAA